MPHSTVRANLDKLYTMLPRATGDDEFSVTVRSLTILLLEMLERGMESDSDAGYPQHMATRFIEAALEYEKKSQEVAKTAEAAKKEAKAWVEILRQDLDKGEASAEPRAVQEGASQEEQEMEEQEMAYGTSTDDEEA